MNKCITAPLSKQRGHTQTTNLRNNKSSLTERKNNSIDKAVIGDIKIRVIPLNAIWNTVQPLPQYP